MWLHKLFVKTLHDQRWQVAGFGLALAATAALDVAIWPAYKDQLKLIELPSAFEAFLGADLAISTPAGYLNAEFFSWIIVLLIAYAVIQGTAAIAGEESSGTMDLLMAQPVRRRDIVLAKSAATITGACAIVLIGFAGFAVSMPFVEMDVAAPLPSAPLSLGDVFVACANMLPITLAFFGLSLWLGAVAPSRGHAAAIAIGIATAAYVAESVAATVDVLSGIRYGSPFYYYGRGLPLVRGIDWTHACTLLASGALFVAFAARSFSHRDITPGGAHDMRLGDVARRLTGGITRA
jgi:ABC-2 type transport system permease protein